MISNSVGPVPKARVDYAAGIQSVHKDETVIKRDRLAVLEAKERAHDDYLYATRMMGRHLRLMQGHEDATGYAACMSDFCQLVVDAGRMREDVG